MSDTDNQKRKLRQVLKRNLTYQGAQGQGPRIPHINHPPFFFSAAISAITALRHFALLRPG